MENHKAEYIYTSVFLSSLARRARCDLVRGESRLKAGRACIQSDNPAVQWEGDVEPVAVEENKEAS